MSRFLDGYPLYRATGETRCGRPIYRLHEDFRYEYTDLLARKPQVIRVEKDFEFDLGSVPRMLWIAVSPTDFIRAFLVHDWLYFTHDFSKWMSDAIFRQALKDDGATLFERWSIWVSVKWCGGEAYWGKRN